MSAKYSVGFDFGTEAVRVLIADVHCGRLAAQAQCNYEHGVIDQVLPSGSARLPADYALQHPLDWIEAASIACREAVKQAAIPIDAIVGLGVDFTSCTMLPARGDGTPLCLIETFGQIPLAWPKLWKHHGAKSQTDRINHLARERGEPWLGRYGGTIGLEWFIPKVLETLEQAPQVYDAAEVWLEAGDWFVWQLIAGPFPACSPGALVRSSCQAGYKATWDRQSGYPSRAFLAAVHPQLADLVEAKMPGVILAPGERAGLLTEAAAELFGLPANIPVSAATIDAHAGVPGAGVAEADTMVLVIGTSSCHMLNSKIGKVVPGVAGVVEDGILPGFFGYEMGQASVGDAFAWVSRTLGRSHESLNEGAAALGPGSGGVLALDWLNGCRTPLMDGRLSGALLGLTLNTRPEQVYRAVMEATACGLRWIVDRLRENGVPVRRYVASGGLPTKSPLLMQIYADVLDAPILLAESEQSVALGAAILGCLAAGSTVTGHATVTDAVRAMARQRSDLQYRPRLADRYARLYSLYRRLAADGGNVLDVMRELKREVES